MEKNIFYGMFYEINNLMSMLNNHLRFINYNKKDNTSFFISIKILCSIITKNIIFKKINLLTKKFQENRFEELP